MKTYKAADLFITNWQEVTYKDLKAIIPFIHLAGKKINALSLHLFKALAKKPSVIKKMTSEQIVDTFKDISTFLKTPLTEFKLTSFRIGFTKYYSPVEMMRTSTFAEYMMLDTNLIRYMKTNDDQYINKIISALYRPQKFGWWYKKRNQTDRRKPFKDSYYNRHKRFGKLSNTDKLIILQTVIGVRIQVMNRFPNLFPDNTTEEEKKQPFDPTKVKDSGPMWSNIRIDIAGTLQISGLDNVDNTNMYTVLALLEKMNIDNKEREDQINKRRRK